MSADIVDDLHAAEDHIGVLESTLNQLWEVMQIPFDWSADTLDVIAGLMSAAGYDQIEEGNPLQYAEYQRDVDSFDEFEERWPRVAAKLRATHTPAPYVRPSMEECDIDDCCCHVH